MSLIDTLPPALRAVVEDGWGAGERSDAFLPGVPAELRAFTLAALLNDCSWRAANAAGVLRALGLAGLGADASAADVAALGDWCRTTLYDEDGPDGTGGVLWDGALKALGVLVSDGRLALDLGLTKRLIAIMHSGSSDHRGLAQMVRLVDPRSDASLLEHFALELEPGACDAFWKHPALTPKLFLKAAFPINRAGPVADDLALAIVRAPERLEDPAFERTAVHLLRGLSRYAETKRPLFRTLLERVRTPEAVAELWAAATDGSWEPETRLGGIVATEDLLRALPRTLRRAVVLGTPPLNTVRAGAVAAVEGDLAGRAASTRSHALLAALAQDAVAFARHWRSISVGVLTRLDALEKAEPEQLVDGPLRPSDLTDFLASSDDATRQRAIRLLGALPTQAAPGAPSTRDGLRR